MVKKRCSPCGRRVKDKRCPGCGSDRYSWGFTVDVGFVGGKHRQTSRWGFDRKSDATAALAAIQSSTDLGTYIEPSRQRLDLYLENWLRAQASQLRPSTLQSYEAAVKLHISPRIGDIRLQSVTATMLDVLYAELLSGGRRDGRGGLSPHSVRNIHAVIRNALSDAARKGLIPRNPAETADPPKLGRSQATTRTWAPGEVQTFLNHVKGDRIYAAWVVAATTARRTALRSTLIRSRSDSTSTSKLRDCPVFAFTTCVTRMRPWHYRQESIRKLSRSALVMRPSRSPSTRTRTSCLPYRGTRRSLLRGWCSVRIEHLRDQNVISRPIACPLRTPARCKKPPVTRGFLRSGGGI